MQTRGDKANNKRNDMTQHIKADASHEKDVDSEKAQQPLDRSSTHDPEQAETDPKLVRRGYPSYLRSHSVDEMHR